MNLFLALFLAESMPIARTCTVSRIILAHNQASRIPMNVYPLQVTKPQLTGTLLLWLHFILKVVARLICIIGQKQLLASQSMSFMRKMALKIAVDDLIFLSGIILRN
jgi:hypothetical protein